MSVFEFPMVFPADGASHVATAVAIAAPHFRATLGSD
jgi:hypothetical protein